MITPAISPNTLNTILHALLDPDQTLADIARTVGLHLDKLMLLLDSPDMQEKIERTQRLLDQRARLLASSTEAAAAGALTTLIEEVRATQADRAQLTRARSDAMLAGKAAELQYADLGIKHLDDRFRQLAEAARSARALLTQSRARLAPARVRRQANAEPHKQEPGAQAPGTADPETTSPGGMATQRAATQSAPPRRPPG